MSSKISESFNKCFETILNTILLDLTSNYNISNKTDEGLVTYDKLYKKYNLLYKSQPKTCIFIKNNGIKCLNKTTNSLANTFCGIHKKHEIEFKNFVEENPKSSVLNFDNSVDENTNPPDLNNLKKKFINDSFYYIDIEEKIIYDNDFIRVGYMDEELSYIIE
jgi:hypothetical protein